MKGWRTEKPFVTIAESLVSKIVAVVSTNERPKASDARTTRPSRSLPRSREAIPARAKKAKIKAASRKDGKGWRTSISTTRPTRISITAYRDFRERLRFIGGTAHLFARALSYVDIR